MDKITRFERARLLSARALQLSLGAPSLAKAPKDSTYRDIARIEFDTKIIPLAVIREYPTGDVKRVEVC
ncbi:MAG: DNA-directed RNA polymerase subunit K [Candidatus Diapherotrites archaeon]